MFNVGTPELLVILLVALLVLGPDKLPGAARQVGRFVGEFRRMSSGFQDELRDALQEPVTAVDDTIHGRPRRSDPVPKAPRPPSAGSPAGPVAAGAPSAEPGAEPGTSAPAAPAGSEADPDGGASSTGAVAEPPPPAAMPVDEAAAADPSSVPRADAEPATGDARPQLMALKLGRSKGAPRPPRDAEGMTLVEHLSELRSRIMKALVALVIGGALGFTLYSPVLDQLVEPYCDQKAEQADRREATGEEPGIDSGCQLVVTDPLESFSIRLKVSAYLGLLFASPVVLYQLWRFITPGLYDNERRYAVPFVVSSIVLFLLGAALALWTFPRTLEFLAAFGGDNLTTLYTPTKYLGLLIFMMLAFGIGFEFPVLLTFLQLAHVLHWRQLAGFRRYAVILVFVVNAIITPSGDPVTLLAMSVPMVLFYEASILIGRFVFRRP